MNIEELAAAIDSVDRRLNKNKKVPEEERTINLSPAYVRYGWGDTASPLPEDAQKSLKLGDKTGDGRWSKHFAGNKRDLAILRSAIGFYWLLRYDSAMGEHFLDHVGAAADVVNQFGE